MAVIGIELLNIPTISSKALANNVALKGIFPLVTPPNYNLIRGHELIFFIPKASNTNAFQQCRHCIQYALACRMLYEVMYLIRQYHVYLISLHLERLYPLAR